jgi:E3 ubiquitin-protein ligase listerin
MKNLCIDYDKRVRLGSFTYFKNHFNQKSVFHEILKIIKKELAPYLKTVIGVWLLGMFDSDSEVSKEALECFSFSFSKKQPKEVLTFCESDALKYLKINFSKTPQSLNEFMIVSEEEAEENYDRVISSSILVLKHLIETIQNVSNVEYSQILDATFFKQIVSPKFVLIRSSMFKLLNVLFQDFADSLIDLKVVTPLVLGCFSEKNPIVHESMTETLLFFLKKYPKECWNNVNASKAIWPKLFTFLSNPTTSSPSLTFPILLPFISMLDFDVFGSDEKSVGFFDKFFESIWKGFLNIQGTDVLDILKAYNVCLMFVILSSSKFVQKDETEYLNHFLNSTFMKSMKYYLETVGNFKC